MIKLPTVLILGAGASHPYGFPLGIGLREAICNGLAATGHQLFGALSACEVPDVEVRNFRNTFFYSRLYSIDAFLAEPQHAAFREIGKLAIAGVLISNEVPENLDRAARGDLVVPDWDNWYQYLWNRLARSDWDGFSDNNLSVVTFNYDRSLEYYLIRAMANRYGKTENECAEKLASTIPIIHVYGQLGDLPFGKVTGTGLRQYNSSADPMNLKCAASSIRVIPEDREKDERLAQVHKFLKGARKICFLGFGFDDLNVERLNVRAYVTPDKSVLSTSFGMTNAERRDAQGVCGLTQVGESGWRCQQLLREHLVLQGN
jgi:hypothetical protein